MNRVLMNRIRMGFDVDDVIYPTLEVLFNWYNRTRGFNFAITDHVTYELSTTWKVSRKKVVQIVLEFFKSVDFLTMKVYPFIKMSLIRLTEIIDLFSVSSRLLEVRKHTKKVLNIDLPNIFQGVFFSDHFIDNTKYKRKKSDICEEYRLNIIVEDCLEYALECARVKVVDRVYLLDSPWNQSQKKIHRKVRRIKGDRRKLHNSLVEYIKNYK